MILGLVSILADRDRRRTASVTSLAMVSMALGVWALHEYGKPLGTARNVSGPSVLSSYAAWGRDQYTDVALIIASVLIAASVIWISRQGAQPMVRLSFGTRSAGGLASMALAALAVGLLAAEFVQYGLSADQEVAPVFNSLGYGVAVVGATAAAVLVSLAEVVVRKRRRTTLGTPLICSFLASVGVLGYLVLVMVSNHAWIWNL